MTRRTTTLLAATAVLGLLCGGSASAQDEAPPERKDPTCVRACRQESKACVKDAKEQQRICRRERCGDLAAAAREAFAADPSTSACAEARAALRECYAACAAETAEDLAACRAENQECVEACPDSSGKERKCVLGCRRELRACLQPATELARGFRVSCCELAEAAKAICEADPRAQECAAARREAKHCVDRCREALQDAVQPCIEALRTCVEACPDRAG